MARHDTLLAGEGAVLLIGRLSPALDVRSAYAHTMHAARRAGREDEIRRLIRHYVADGLRREFMTSVLGRELGLE